MKILLEYDLETKDIYQVINITVQIDVWPFIFKGTDELFFQWRKTIKNRDFSCWNSK